MKLMRLKKPIKTILSKQNCFEGGVNMYRCENCGWEGSADERKAVKDYRGECWGQPAYETEYYCPECESDVELIEGY